jgi:phospholipid transport system substrate-binding protein
MKFRYVVIILLLILVVPLRTYAGDPTDTVKTYVDEVLNVLKTSSAETDASDNSKKEEIRKIAGRMFDFSAMSKATLGKNWKKLAEEQRPEFVRLFRSMLENAYTSKIMGYTDEKAVFIKERSLSKTRVEVQSNLVTGRAEIPMHYRMLKMKDQWKVYDVIIEGISLIKNYRTQFREILAKQSPEELLQVMRKKVKEI